MNWRFMWLGMPVWAEVGKIYQPATILGIGQSRGDQTRVKVRLHHNGCMGFQYAGRLKVRRPELSGDDRPVEVAA